MSQALARAEEAQKWQIFNFFQASTSQRCGVDGCAGGWGLIHKRSLAPTPPATWPAADAAAAATSHRVQSVLGNRALGLQCNEHFAYRQDFLGWYKTYLPNSRVQSVLSNPAAGTLLNMLINTLFPKSRVQYALGLQCTWLAMQLAYRQEFLGGYKTCFQN